MAISVDTVYQRVLAILNKEQRGYLSPTEYNLFANQAELDIFEQYFYDLNQFSRLPGNSTEYSDMVDILEEKISLFETSGSTTYANNYWPEPSDLYRLGSVIYNGSEAEHVNKNEYLYITSSPLSKPTNDFPIYTRGASGIKVYGNSEITADVTFQYIKKPNAPNEVEWAFTEVNGNALWNSSSSENFHLHESEETELVIKILQLAGVSIKDPSIYQMGTAEEVKSTQQEKA
jgi:hypothetical protein